MAGAGLALALVATGCSGGAKTNVVRRPAATTSSPEVLGERVVATAPAAGGDASRFTLGDGTTVLVPAGALAKGAEVRVRRAADGVGAGDGAIEGGPAAYEVTVSSGTIQKPVAVQIAVADAPGRSAPVAVRYDDATRTWTPTNSDAAPGTLTVYAAKPGTYGWVRWSWEGAAGVAAQTVRAALGSPDGAEPSVSCGDAAAVAARFAARGPGNGALRWCAGTVGGEDRVQVANRVGAPVTLVASGLSDGTTTRRSPLSDGAVEILRRHAQGPEGSALDVLAPGDRTAFRLTPTVAARAGARQDGLSQAFVAVSGAAAFAVGLYAGSPALASAVLAQEEVRSLLLQDLDAPGCGDAAVAESAEVRPADAVAASLRTLVTRCMKPATAAAIVTAAGKRSELRAAFAARTTAVPDDGGAYLAPAAALAVEPLVAEEASIDITLTPVEPPPTTTTVPTVPGATTTVPGAPAATTTTVPLPFNTTTVQTAPPAGGTTTTTARTTTTVGATTTTGAATPPTLALQSTVCLAIGTSIPLTGANLTPSQRWTLTFTPPRGAAVTANGNATASGTMTSSFSCRGRVSGAWTVRLTDASGRVSAPASFTVV